VGGLEIFGVRLEKSYSEGSKVEVLSMVMEGVSMGGRVMNESKEVKESLGELVEEIRKQHELIEAYVREHGEDRDEEEVWSEALGAYFEAESYNFGSDEDSFILPEFTEDERVHE